VLLTDIDECASKENVCGVGAVCENTIPGYNCLCPQGYTAKPDPKIACEQVNLFCVKDSRLDLTSMIDFKYSIDSCVKTD
jgi:hypothetical protein